MPSKIDFLVANLRHENRTRPTARSPDPWSQAPFSFAIMLHGVLWKPFENLRKSSVSVSEMLMKKAV